MPKRRKTSKEPVSECRKGSAGLFNGTLHRRRGGDIPLEQVSCCHCLAEHKEEVMAEKLVTEAGLLCFTRLRRSRLSCRDSLLTLEGVHAPEALAAAETLAVRRGWLSSKDRRISR